MKKNIRVITNPAFFVFLGALISALGGWWATREQDEDNEKNQNEIKARDNEIMTLQRQLLKTTNAQLIEQKELRRKSEEIAELNAEIAEAQKELYKKSEELATLNLNNARLISGEGSFCVIYILPAGSDRATVLIMHHGDSPLYDMRIKIMTEYDQQKIKQYEQDNPNSSNLLDSMISAGRQYKINSLGIGVNRVLESMSYQWKEKNKFEIEVIAHNGYWIEKFEFNNGKLKYRVLKVNREEKPGIKPKVLAQEGYGN